MFDVDGGVLGQRRPLVTFGGDDGVPEGLVVPDGLVVDSQGALWVAVNGAGQVCRFSPDGEVLEVVEVPVPGVTACTLDGPSLTDLFVTTSREGDDTPGAGALYATAVDIPGLPVLPFAG